MTPSRTGDDADTITGDDGNDVIDAGIDDDLVDGGRGNDTILGSEGDDTIDGGNGDDLIYGGLNDVIGDALDLPDAVDLRPDNNRDSIIGGDGNDTIYGRDDDDTIDGGAGNDLIDGGIDEDSILGGTGNDTVLGSQGADTAAGGDDRDVFLIGTQERGHRRQHRRQRRRRRRRHAGPARGRAVVGGLRSDQPGKRHHHLPRCRPETRPARWTFHQHRERDPLLHPRHPDRDAEGRDAGGIAARRATRW
jgi:hypothetical protein